MNPELEKDTLLENISKWKEDFIEDNNNVFAGQAYMDSRVVASKIIAMNKDIFQLLKYVEEITKHLNHSK